MGKGFFYNEWISEFQSLPMKSTYCLVCVFCDHNTGKQKKGIGVSATLV